MSRHGRSWAPVGALLAVAACLRVSAMFYGTLSGDDATVALVAKHVLSAENFPVFFYRQRYMGSLNGIHLVPALYVFGPSVLLVRLNAIAWSLLFPLGVYLLTRRIYDERTGRVALALAAVPPFLLTYWSTVAEPHFETNVFGVWLLLLALRALTASSDAARTRALAAFGLLAGAAVWTNPKAVVVVGPALLLLALRSPRRLLGHGALVAGGLLLGSLPAWLFYLTDTGTAPRAAGQLLGVEVDLSLAHFQEFWIEMLDLVGAYYWVPDTPWRRAALALNCVLSVVALGFGLVELWRAWRTHGPSDRSWGLGLVLLTFAASLGAVYFSSLAAGSLAHASRYALPAYIPLLVCAGALVARASRWSRPAGAALLACLLLFALWTHGEFLWPLSPAMRAHESAVRAGRQAVIERLAARPVEALYVDDRIGGPIWAFLLNRPVVSSVISDVYVPHAVAADAAERVAFLESAGSHHIEAGLEALGATWEDSTAPGWTLFQDVRVPARSYRMVPRSGWQVPGDSRTPTSVADGDLGTAWPVNPRRGPSESLIVDLGRPHDLARVILWPSLPTPDLRPLRVSGSADGTHWKALGMLPAAARQPTFMAAGRPVFRSRNGWVELAVPPRPLRYLRVEPAEPRVPWGVAELQVYEALDGPAPGGTTVDDLVERLRDHRLNRLLADPVLSARVARATHGRVSTLVANGAVDNHGASPPEWLARPVRLRAHDGLLVPREDLPELRERLDAAGVRYLAEAVGDHALVRVLGPIASTAPCRVPAHRHATREPATDGRGPRLSLEAVLVEETLVSGLRLWEAAWPTSGAPGVEVAVSRDGRTWQPAAGATVVPGWGWAGRTLFADSDGHVEIVLDPTPARHVRVIVGSDADEVKLLCVRGTRVAGR